MARYTMFSLHVESIQNGGEMWSERVEGVGWRAGRGYKLPGNCKKTNNNNIIIININRTNKRVRINFMSF